MSIESTIRVVETSDHDIDGGLVRLHRYETAHGFRVYASIADGHELANRPDFATLIPGRFLSRWQAIHDTRKTGDWADATTYHYTRKGALDEIARALVEHLTARGAL